MRSAVHALTSAGLGGAAQCWTCLACRPRRQVARQEGEYLAALLCKNRLALREVPDPASDEDLVPLPPPRQAIPVRPPATASHLQDRLGPVLLRQGRHHADALSMQMPTPLDVRWGMPLRRCMTSRSFSQPRSDPPRCMPAPHSPACCHGPLDSAATCTWGRWHTLGSRRG